jgi:hypothetical protein
MTPTREQQKVEDPYFVSVFDNKCPHCRKGETWAVVGPDGMGGQSFDEEEDAQALADALNDAWWRGRNSLDASLADAPPAAEPQELVARAYNILGDLTLPLGTRVDAAYAVLHRALATPPPVPVSEPLQQNSMPTKLTTDDAITHLHAIIERLSGPHVVHDRSVLIDVIEHLEHLASVQRAAAANLEHLAVPAQDAPQEDVAASPAAAPPPADLVKAARALLGAYGREVTARTAWATKPEPWSPESGQMFEAVLARESETREVALALGRLVFPEESATLAWRPPVAASPVTPEGAQ